MSLKFNCLGLRVTYPVIKITDLKICILARFIPFHSIFLRKQVSLIHFVNIPAKQTKKGIPLYISIRCLDFPRSPQTTIEPVERFVTFVSCAVIVSSELSRKRLGQSTETIMTACGSILSLLGEFAAQVLTIRQTFNV